MKRWIPILYRTKGAGDHDFILGPSHEEIVTHSSKIRKIYTKISACVYIKSSEIQNELRKKPEFARTRIWDEGYVLFPYLPNRFWKQYYEKVKIAYLRVYKRLELKLGSLKLPAALFRTNFPMNSQSNSCRRRYDFGLRILRLCAESRNCRGKYGKPEGSQKKQKLR